MNKFYLTRFAKGLSCLLIMQLRTDNLADSSTYVICFFKFVKIAVFVDVILKASSQFAKYLLRHLQRQEKK